MGKRGPKPRGRVRVAWSRNFAYAIGLLASDGCLSPSGRHIVFVSKDREQIENFLSAIGIKNHIGRNSSGAWRVQFGDVLFYQYLISIGFMANKSKVLGEIKVPRQYALDFIRGVFDGDGSTYSYWDTRWRKSFMYYVSFASASKTFVEWLRETIRTLTGISGHMTHARKKNTYQLKYAKSEGLLLLRRMYRNTSRGTRLSRKHLKVKKMLAIVGEQL